MAAKIFEVLRRIYKKAGAPLEDTPARLDSYASRPNSSRHVESAGAGRPISFG
jgi:hypothetical protein